MADYCTIFARGTDVGDIPDRLRAYAPLGIAVIGPAHAWERIVVQTTGATLTLNAMRRTGGGDVCSKTLLGAVNFFRRIRTPAVVAQQLVVEHLRACRLVIGVVGSPAFSASGQHEAMIEATARAVDGMIFNGRAMFDASGTLLLDRDGQSDQRAA